MLTVFNDADESPDPTSFGYVPEDNFLLPCLTSWTFFSRDQNKSQLLIFLSKYRCVLVRESSFIGSRSLCIGGRFQVMSKCVVLTVESV